MTSVYAAPFEPAPGRPGWLLVQRTGDQLRRVDIVSDWLLACAASTSAANTLKSYAEALALWWRWCVDTGVDPLRADAVQFAQFILALQSVPKGYPLTSEVRALPGDPRLRSAGTVRNRALHVKSFYAWAYDNGRMALGTGRAITGFKTPRAPKGGRADRLEPQHVRDLLALDYHPRDRFIIELLYGCGLREGEAIGLHIPDMCTSREIAAAFGCRIPSTAGPHLHVRRRLNSNGATAKSPYERVVPLTVRVMQAYRDWQAWAYEHAPEINDSPYLIISLSGPTRGRPLSLSGFNSMWVDKVRMVLPDKVVNPHLLRHTYASELVDAGVPAFTIQELLGHRSPTSTQVYTHALMTTLSSAVEQLAEWRNRAIGSAA